MPSNSSDDPASAGVAGIRRTARCACGSASITVEGEPEQHNVCHCSNCKRRTGSAFGISTYFGKANVVAQSGETHVHAFHHAGWKHDQARHFCKVCGTTLFWFISTRPLSIGIAGGCFADENLGEPTAFAAHAQKLPWVEHPRRWKSLW
jgi:hypothetical protein